jgi:serine/threonine protein kinase
MKALLPNYQYFQTIQEDAYTVLYRAVREPEQTPVLIKHIKTEYPNLEEITRLKHEFAILQSLQIPGVLESETLNDAALVMILKDFGGEPLSTLITQNLTGFQSPNLQQFLSIAVQLAETLAQLHQHKIIHKNLKSANVLFNPKTGQVKIADFSIATRLSRETPAITNPQLLEGTLAYMSPEQTGRMNRTIDYRTDFYSLGVIFYELLTGQLPFQSTDPLELVHCHIAKT